ncbi:TorF family putative porin [Flavobacterium buctense]|uniref:TorF family putative porin n=1 Tax=Flavobacterium buctense TaxID=1648146 RepID=A0ABU9E0J4_9FLAO|nr:TorF family putative porin [Flavobacterium buctense]
MKYSFFTMALLFGLHSIPSFSQENKVVIDSIIEKDEKKLSLNLDVVSRYLWRGQCWGGDYVAIQPTIEYAVSSKLSLGFWATTNFKSDYFYPDGVSAYKGYQEIDFYVTYQITDFLQFQLWDYYWPSVSSVEGVDNTFFNYGSDGSKTVDAMLYFDFSEGYQFPFNATISTLVAGNDFRYDSNGENPKQNFTTYLELGYAFDFFQNIEISPVVGAVLNNKAAYYTYADYGKVSFTNFGITATKEFDLGNGISMPIALNYTHNGASKNTELFGKNFWIVTLSFSY